MLKIGQEERLWEFYMRVENAPAGIRLLNANSALAAR
jgi:hypothetical protein